jgi:hypothetical protein
LLAIFQRSFDPQQIVEIDPPGGFIRDGVKLSWTAATRDRSHQQMLTGRSMLADEMLAAANSPADRVY